MSVVSFATRRTISVVAFAFASFFTLAIYWVLDTALVREFTLGTGIALLGVCLLLALFNARKKIPFIPALPGAVWMQFHIYLGLFSGVLFLVHISFNWPTGWFESLLALAFSLVFLSGVFGLVITRRLPRRLTMRGEQVLFERIPALRRTLMKRAEAVVEHGVTDSGARGVADFYDTTLRSYFIGGRNFLSHLAQSNAPRHRLVNEIECQKRYLTPAEMDVMDELKELALQKDDLDFQHACQTMLKLWLFVHIPLTFSLLVFAFVHAILVLTYRPFWI